jgi:diaminopimelate decarboxylase
MNDLLRPALYDAYHHITAIDNDDNQISKTYDVVGPICESSDVFAKNITLPELQEGSALLIHDAGAYGHVMASSYNCRFIPAEIMLGDDNNSQALKVVRGAIDLIGLS